MNFVKDTDLLILHWYNFIPNSSVLVIEEDSDVFTSYLKNLDINLSVEQVSIRQSAKKVSNDDSNKYDYIIAIGILEKCFTPALVLKQWQSLLKDNGYLFLGTQNRLGIHFFCGDRDPYTGSSFDSIENYLHVADSSPKALGGKLYARAEICDMLFHADFKYLKFYSVYPALSAPQLLCSEDYLPNENLNVRISPVYRDNQSIFLDEIQLYNTLVENNLFHQLANAYFIVCSKKDFSFSEQYITLPLFRKEDSFITIIYKDNTVEKRILAETGIKKLSNMKSIASDLKSHGVKLIDFDITQNSIKMPFIDAPLVVTYLIDLAESDKEKFILEVDHFKKIISQSSNLMDIDSTKTLEKGYIDLMPINAFYIDGDFFFFDQEFVYENCPVDVLIRRFVDFIYDAKPQIDKILPRNFFYERYCLQLSEPIYRKYIDNFMGSLLNKSSFTDVNKKSFADYMMLHFNKFCMKYHNYPDRQQLIDTCFDNLKNKKLFIFGAGKYADKFLAFYKDEYEISAVIDNSPAKQGSEIHGFTITSLGVLQGLNPEEYKVIICAFHFEEMWMQLRMRGVKHIGLYYSNYIYQGRQNLIPLLEKTNKTESKKKYHIGYIAGVFDLYHLGHLNMFRRAKEQCDYLIVGVTSDRYVRELKKKEPFVPFEERLELVRSCKYVDEAHEIPFEYGGTVEAFQKYHFDVQFSGSDYVNHPWWLEQQAYLRSHGSDLVFFPYTEQTSSTKIKELIVKGLL